MTIFRVINWLPIDSQGRVVLTDFFNDKIPQWVSISFNSSNGELYITEENTSPIRRKIDDRNRLCIPSKLRRHFQKKEVCLIYDTEKRHTRLFSSDYVKVKTP